VGGTPGATAAAQGPLGVCNSQFVGCICTPPAASSKACADAPSRSTLLLPLANQCSGTGCVKPLLLKSSPAGLLLTPVNMPVSTPEPLVVMLPVAAVGGEAGGLRSCANTALPASFMRQMAQRRSAAPQVWFTAVLPPLSNTKVMR